MAFKTILPRGVKRIHIAKTRLTHFKAVYSAFLASDVTLPVCGEKAAVIARKCPLTQFGVAAACLPLRVCVHKPPFLRRKSRQRDSCAFCARRRRGFQLVPRRPKFAAFARLCLLSACNKFFPPNGSFSPLKKYTRRGRRSKSLARLRI